MSFVANIEVSLKKTDGELKLLSEDELKTALKVYLRSHFDTLTRDEPLQLVDLAYYSCLSKDILKKLLEQQVYDGTDQSLDLSRAELLLSLFVEKVYVAKIEQIGAHDTYELEDILRSVKEMVPLNIFDRESIAEVRTNVLDFMIILYENDRIENVDDEQESNDSEVINEFDNINLYSHSNNVEPKNTTMNLQQMIARASTYEQNQFQNCIAFQELPTAKFDDFWSTLRMDLDFKASVLNQVVSAYVSSKRSLGKILLFHGPPGSGKSTFCKAISQKLSIRYQNARIGLKTYFLQISCERVFSKWYGESSNNLVSLFSLISRIIDENSKSMVILLIDEVETIASSRKQTLEKNESTDGIRIVNTLLTQLDFLKQHSNLLILATSNLLDSIDVAFIDRTDGCFFMNKPDKEQIFEILFNETNILIGRKEIISVYGMLSVRDQQVIEILRKLSTLCYEKLQISGRSLSKLPQIAIAQSTSSSAPGMPLTNYLASLSSLIIQKSSC